jgi:hypothetical protein
VVVGADGDVGVGGGGRGRAVCMGRLRINKAKTRDLAVLATISSLTDHPRAISAVVDHFKFPLLVSPELIGRKKVTHNQEGA